MAEMGKEPAVVAVAPDEVGNEEEREPETELEVGRVFVPNAVDETIRQQNQEYETEFRMR